MDDSSGRPATRDDRRDGPERGAIGLGIFLILVGAVFFAAEVLHVDWQGYGWPSIVVIVGLVLLALGFSIGGDGGLGAAIPGGIVTVVGLVLAFQNATDTWASWAYAWALVAPGSVGVTLLLYGIVHWRGDLVDSGARTAMVGLGLFVGFGLFFESIIGIDRGHGSTAMSQALPIAAIALGVIIVLGSLVSSRGRPRSGE